MSFFRREAETETPGAAPRNEPSNAGLPSGRPGGARERSVTRIADGTKIVGEVGGATELLVEGEVEGQIRVDSRVVVGQGGLVRGQIAARSVLIAGRVAGDVRGSDRVEVGGSGKLEGDIAAPRVTIAEGAFFKGKVEMGGGDRERRNRSAAPPGPSPREATKPGASEARSAGDLYPEGREAERDTGSAPSGGERR